MLLTFYIKTFKILTCSVLILGLKLYRFGLFSKGFYCLLFNVLFCSVLAERFLLYINFISLSTLFFTFSEILFFGVGHGILKEKSVLGGRMCCGKSPRNLPKNHIGENRSDSILIWVSAQSGQFRVRKAGRRYYSVNKLR